MHKYTCMWIHVVLYMFVHTCINIYAGINLENSYIYIHIHEYVHIFEYSYVCVYPAKRCISRRKYSQNFARTHSQKSALWYIVFFLI